MKKLTISIFLSIPLLFQLHTVHAAGNESPRVSLPFSVSFDMPSNQEQSTKDYFNLEMKPNQVETVNIILQNTSQDVLSLDIKPSNAVMSLSGGIVYDDKHGSDYTYLTSKAYYMDQYLSLPKEVILNPNETKKVPVTIKAPNQALGTILGGVLFIPKEDEQKKSNKSEVSFNSRTLLRLNVPIQMNLPNIEQSRDIKIDKSEVLIFPSGANVTFEMENPNNRILKGIGYRYSVKSEDGKPLFNGSIPPFSVAPKSKVTIPIPWNYELYKSGKYQLVLEPSYNHKSIINSFSISEKDVKNYVVKTHQKLTTPVLAVPMYVWFLVAILLLFLLYVAYRLGKSKGDSRTKLSEEG